MNKELFFIGKPAPFEKGVLIYPPSGLDVITNNKYNGYVKILTYSQEDIEDIFTEEGGKVDSFPTPLEFLLGNCYNNKEYENLCKEAFKFFTHEEVIFLYEEKIIMFGDLNEILVKIQNLEELSKIPSLTEDNFLTFQNIIRESVNLKVVEPPNPNEHPKVKAMKAKQRLRDKVKAKQGRATPFFNSLVAICCMGVGVTPLNIGEMSYVAISSIIDMYQSKEQYELDIDSLLAGGDSKKIKPKYWIENFEK